jgi:hypothetical protein
MPGYMMKALEPGMANVGRSWSGPTEARPRPTRPKPDFGLTLSLSVARWGVGGFCRRGMRATARVSGLQSASQSTLHTTLAIVPTLTLYSPLALAFTFAVAVARGRRCRVHAHQSAFSLSTCGQSAFSTFTSPVPGGTCADSCKRGFHAVTLLGSWRQVLSLSAMHLEW